MRTLEFRTGKYESFGIGYGADSYWGLAIAEYPGGYRISKYQHSEWTEWVDLNEEYHDIADQQLDFFESPLIKERLDQWKSECQVWTPHPREFSFRLTRGNAVVFDWSGACGMALDDLPTGFRSLIELLEALSDFA
jgi:hypothetical protein